ncbi:CoB--CoM heterodisulfide reductase iron-sulfur subunit A family protein [bacterium]|nr:CoB--CoM heterodisulfide reductase iron-sulfur subunit A family protein [bacterium]
MEKQNIKTDVLIIGGGIAGLQAALDLGDQGFSVLIVEKEASIGGRMINLSKVFPTLDCSSCICTPKMAAAAHHDKISIMTLAQPTNVEHQGAGFAVTVREQPRYLNAEDCTGCRLCEYACPVDLVHEVEGNLGARKAIYVPFNNAIPQVALLDMDNCIMCGACEKACPTHCIDYLQEPREHTIEAGAIIVATGLDLAPMDVKAEYGGGKLVNVLHGLQVERLLAPHGPYGRVLRPSDGKVPDTVAYIQCAGSRDHSIGIPYCSRVCCMYAIKQAMLLSGALPLVEVFIYYMDIRAFGKGFEEFYQNAKAMGIEFIKAKVAQITEDEHRNPVLRYEDQVTGRVEERAHDLVVLSQGVVPAWDPRAVLPVEVGGDGFIAAANENVAPCRTSITGVFAAGVATGPKDIPDSIVQAGAAAAEAAAYLRGNDKVESITTADRPAQRPVEVG